MPQTHLTPLIIGTYKRTFHNPMTYDKIDFLEEVYEDYCTKHKLPFVSADEQDDHPIHSKWFNKFIELWDYAQS